MSEHFFSSSSKIGFVQSGMTLSFQTNLKDNLLCTKTLTKLDAEIFQHAILHHYWYQMYIDDLPIWGMVGEIYDHPIMKPNDLTTPTTSDLSTTADALESPFSPKIYKLYVYTRKKFSIAYNQHRIVEVNLTSEDPRLVEEGVTLDFNYDVTWIQTTKSFEKRFERYLDYSFFEHQIHWFSIFNSFMMVIFLVGLVSLILIRTLRNDYAKYMRDEEDLDETERGVGEESGWKQVHGDVFRSPPYLTLFTALYGAGHQVRLC
jgi:transmembrane 9 superfamily protein 3